MRQVAVSCQLPAAVVVVDLAPSSQQAEAVVDGADTRAAGGSVLRAPEQFCRLGRLGGRLSESQTRPVVAPESL